MARAAARFGIVFLPETLTGWGDLCREAEDTGFEWLGVADSQSVFRELYVPLTVAALHTRRVRLGPLVTNPLTRHLVVTARAIASVDQLSAARAVLALPPPHPPPPPTAPPPPPPPGRAAGAGERASTGGRGRGREPRLPLHARGQGRAARSAREDPGAAARVQFPPPRDPGGGQREPARPLGPDRLPGRPLRDRGHAGRLRGPDRARDGRGCAAVPDHRLRAGPARVHAPVGPGGRGPRHRVIGSAASRPIRAVHSVVTTERLMTTRRAFLAEAAGAVAGLTFVRCGLLTARPAAAQAPRRMVSVAGRRVKTVDGPAHAAVPEAMPPSGPPASPPGLLPKLLMGAPQERLALMDAQGIDVQALSINPYWYKADRDVATRICQIQNEKLAEVCAATPDRFVAYPTLALQHPHLPPAHTH